jgi:hypothetical protein
MHRQHKKDVEDELARMKREMVNIVYGSGYKVTLDSGRVLTMTSLVQRPTYSGMTEGLPTRKYNDGKVNYDHDSETYVLHAPRLYGNFSQMLPPDSPLARKCAENPYEMLPGVTCIARMTSKLPEPVVKIKKVIEPPAASCLTLVWFQNFWAMPIAPEVMKKLKAMDWDALTGNKG